jgi:hypothetical protein
MRKKQETGKKSEKHKVKKEVFAFLIICLIVYILIPYVDTT